MPTAVLCTDVFAAAATAMATVHGDPGHPFATLRHPLASLDGAGVADRARAVLAQVTDLLGVS